MKGRGATFGNHGKVDIVLVLHVKVHAATVQVVAHVVHQQQIVSLLRVVDQQRGVLGTRDYASLMRLLRPFNGKRIWNISMDYALLPNGLHILLHQHLPPHLKQVDPTNHCAVSNATNSPSGNRCSA